MVTATNSHRFWLPMLLICLSLLPFKMAQAALTASVDRTMISKNDIIQLTIRSDKGPLEQTDFTALEKNFSIINKRRSNQISIINGDKQATYDLTLALLPKLVGTLTIPAFKRQGESSQPIQVEVSKGSIDPKQSHPKVFFDNQVNKQEIYVQEQLLYTLRLFHAVGLSEAQITPLDVKNAVFEPVGDQKKYQTVIDGIRYSVVEKQYAIFPEKSGQLILPELIFTGRAISIHNSYNNRINNSQFLDANRYIRSRSASYVINVLPKPASYPTSEIWLPTPALYINDSWDNNLPNLKVGEPVTRTLTLSAENLTAAQLPDLKLPTTTQFKIYPDQAKSEDRHTANGLMGHRSFSTAIVPSETGTIKFPAIKVTWWNTNSKKIEESIVPAKILTVLPSTQVNNSNQQFNTVLNSASAQRVTAPQVNATSSGLWPIISLIFALLWLGTAYLWWRAKQTTNSKGPSESPSLQTSQNARAAHKTFKKTCLKGNAKIARQSLLDWFSLNHADQKNQQLKDIIQFYQDEELTHLIQELETHLYGYAQSTNTWHGMALLKALEHLEKVGKQQKKNNHEVKLKPLYPL